VTSVLAFFCVFTPIALWIPNPWSRRLKRALCGIMAIALLVGALTPLIGWVVAWSRGGDHVPEFPWRKVFAFAVSITVMFVPMARFALTGRLPKRYEPGDDLGADAPHPPTRAPAD
jgi:MFS family permease